MVDAASTAVLLWVLMSRPGTVQQGLLPRLVDAQVGRVNQAALNDVGKVPAHVLKSHPKCRKAMSSVHHKQASKLDTMPLRPQISPGSPLPHL